jgi:hypothetical protein
MVAQYLDLTQTQLLNTWMTGTQRTLQACLTQLQLAVAAVVLARKVKQSFTELNMFACMQLIFCHKQRAITVAKPRCTTVLIPKVAIGHKPELFPATCHDQHLPFSHCNYMPSDKKYSFIRIIYLVAGT